MLARLQSNVLLRAASSYKTVSGDTLQMITGIIPTDLLVAERQYMYTQGQENRHAVFIASREKLHQFWQER